MNGFLTHFLLFFLRFHLSAYLLLALGTAGDDFFALGIINNYTYLLYDLGGGLASVRSLLKIDHTRTWHSIVAGRSGRSGYVYLDDQTPVHVTSPGVLTGLDVYSPLYIGGVHDFSKLPPIVRAYFNTGFVGTIFEAGFRTSSTDFTPLLTVPIGAVPSGVTGVPVERGLNIGDSAVNECVPNPCKNNGICSQNGTCDIFGKIRTCSICDSFTLPRFITRCHQI